MAKEKLGSTQIGVREYEELTSRIEAEESPSATVERDYIEVTLGSVLAVLMFAAVHTLPGLVMFVLPAEVYVLDRIHEVFRGARENTAPFRGNHGEDSVVRPQAYRPATN